jgi:hypothetical protein
MMARILLVILILCSVSSGFSNENTDDFKPYLQLAIPIPKENYDFLSGRSGQRRFQHSLYTILLHVDKKGRVEHIEYPEELTADGQDWNEPLGDVKFNFLNGTMLDFPIIVPVKMSITGSVSGDFVRFRFPISQSLRTIPHLMDQFFELNGVQFPRVIDFWPVAYMVDTKRLENVFPTVTALVEIDSTGDLKDLHYPIKGQDQSTHQIHVALINAQYEPARIQDKPIPSEFILVFRIYDKIEYPFSPTRPKDTIAPFAGAEDFFMSQFYSFDDILTVPVPRNHRDGKVASKEYGEKFNSRRRYSIIIDTAGNVDMVHLMSDSPRRSEKVVAAGEKILSQISWYPAVNKEGNYTRFAGQVILIFDGTHQVVYIPEWLSR